MEQGQGPGVVQVLEGLEPVEGPVQGLGLAPLLPPFWSLLRVLSLLWRRG